jgi:hypothetical protein
MIRCTHHQGQEVRDKGLVDRLLLAPSPYTLTPKLTGGNF